MSLQVILGASLELSYQLKLIEMRATLNHCAVPFYREMMSYSKSLRGTLLP